MVQPKKKIHFSFLSVEILLISSGHETNNTFILCLKWLIWWHHQINEREFEQTPGDSEGQGSLVYCHPQDHKELDTAEQMNHNSVWNAWNTTGANRERLCSCSTYYVVRETGINQIITVIKSGKIYIFVKNIYMCVCVCVCLCVCVCIIESLCCIAEINTKL